MSKYKQMKTCSISQVIKDGVAVTVMLILVGTMYFADDRDGKRVLLGSKRRKRN